MKEYIIAINSILGNGKEHTGYFSGEGEGSIGIPAPAFSNNSFHVARVETSPLVFNDNIKNAKIMTPKNMVSWLNRITGQLPYADIDIREIRIIDVTKEGEK